MRSLTGRGAVLGVVVGLALTTAVPALATGGDDVRGSCTGNSGWRLKADSNDGRIRVEARVDDARVGQLWKWRILHDGYVSFHGRKRADAGGYVRVERTVVDTSGYDAIGWRARNARTGERCKGQLTL